MTADPSTRTTAVSFEEAMTRARAAHVIVETFYQPGNGYREEHAARERAEEALRLVDEPYPLEVFPERTDEQRDAIFAAMRAIDKYATEWFYAHVARERGRVAREAASGKEAGATE